MVEKRRCLVIAIFVLAVYNYQIQKKAPYVRGLFCSLYVFDQGKAANQKN